MSLNLCLLPQAEQDAIEADKLAWFEAYMIIVNMDRPQIFNKLNSLSEVEREDLRRRLNTIQENKK